MWKSQSDLMHRNVHNGSKDQSKSIILIMLLIVIIMHFPFSVCTECQLSQSHTVSCVNTKSYRNKVFFSRQYFLLFKVRYLLSPLHKKNKNSKKNTICHVLVLSLSLAELSSLP